MLAIRRKLTILWKYTDFLYPFRINDWEVQKRPSLFQSWRGFLTLVIIVSVVIILFETIALPIFFVYKPNESFVIDFTLGILFDSDFAVYGADNEPIAKEETLFLTLGWWMSFLASQIIPAYLFQFLFRWGPKEDTHQILDTFEKRLGSYD